MVTQIRLDSMYTFKGRLCTVIEKTKATFGRGQMVRVRYLDKTEETLLASYFRQEAYR